MIKQAFQPIPIPKEAYPREGRKILEGVAEEGASDARPLTPNDVVDAAKDGVEMAIGEILNGKENEGGESPTKLMGKRRGRREGGGGRPIAAAMNEEKHFSKVEKMESVSVFERFKYLQDRGEEFSKEGLLKDPAKSR